MRLTIVHETCQRYDAPVVRSAQVLRLTPPDCLGQRVVAWRLLAPEACDLGLDGYGNRMHLLTVDGEHRQVCVKAFGTVDVEAMPVRPADELSSWLFLAATDLTEPGDGLRDLSLRYAGRALTPARLRELSAAIHAQFHTPARPGARTAAVIESWESGVGGPVEQAQALIAACRLLGLPARLVCGYVLGDEPGGAGVSSHAWAEVWLAGAWHSADVALQRQAGARHIRLAVGRDHLDACPMRSMGHGSLHGGSLIPVAGRGDETLAQVMAGQQQQQ